jgi:hypothetical protein
LAPFGFLDPSSFMPFHHLAAVIAVAVVLSTPVAWADDKQEAEKHFEAGVSLQKVEDFEAAVTAFEASLRLYPTRSALFNLANCLRATHRYAEALDALERLQREYGDELDEPMRTAVETQLAELVNLTAELVIAADQDGATVRVDDRIIGHTPLSGPIRLSPGPHVVEASLAGFEPARVNVELVSRETLTHRFTLEKIQSPQAAEPPPATPPPAAGPPPAVEPPPPVAPPDRGASTLGTAGWVTAGVGAAVLAGGAATGIWALTLDGELEEACTDGHCPSRRESDIDRLETLAVTTNVLLGVGLAATAAGITMLVFDSPPRSPPPESSGVAVSLGPGYFGAVLRRKF